MRFEGSEAAVEKRVFSLATKERGCSNVVGWVGWSISALILSSGARWRHEPYWYLWWPLLVLGSLIWLRRLLSDRSRRLEISDEGLAATSLLRRTVRIGWDNVRSVRPVAWYSPDSFWLFNVAVMRVTGVRQSIAIPEACESFDHVMDLIRQHLPESVFVTR